MNLSPWLLVPRPSLVFLLGLLAAPAVIASAPAASPSPPPPPAILLVLGAPGEPDYGSNFVQQLQHWQTACRQRGLHPLVIGTGVGPSPAADLPASTADDPASAGAGLNIPSGLTDRQQLEHALARERKDSLDPFWLVLIGHGTFDGKEARFNLRGPDVTATELAAWLKPFQRPLLVLNTASASAPFLNALSGTNRVIITATRSGHEVNLTRFGDHFAQALIDPGSDLDQDGQTSLLETFLRAAHGTAEFYKTEGRLATEHALIDDNGDGLGTPAEWFSGIRASKKAEGGASLDGARAHQIHLLPSPSEQALSPTQRQRRDALELQLERLRETKASTPEDEYYRKLEQILLELARLQLPVETRP